MTSVLGGAATGTVLRVDGVTLAAGPSAAALGPLALAADDHGLTFWSAGADRARALPWDRVGTVAVTDRAGAAELRLRTDRADYRVRVPGWEASHLVAVLAPVLPAGTDLVEPAVVEPAVTEPAAAEAAVTELAVIEPAGAEPAARRGRRTTAPNAAMPAPRRPEAGAPTTFERVKPVLMVTLVVAVATMVALVLAQSTGAIHLGWLGGSGGNSLPSTVPLAR